MSEPEETEEGRLEELFVADLLFGLDNDERAEFEAAAERTGADLQSLGDVLGLLDAECARRRGDRLPSAVRNRILEQAADEFDRSPAFIRPSASAKLLPWFAVAAALMVAVSAWFVVGKGGAVDAASQRRDLLASAADVVVTEWAAGPTPVAGAAGDVAWSSSRQRGFMRFRGLPKNDPAVEQYQLWIFDRNQDEKTPVDGGVFDVSKDGEVVVPISAKLNVKEPYLFAVTVEKPGGVVVSSRSRLPLLASVKR